MSKSTKSVRRYRGDATHDLYWRASLPGLGGTLFFVRQTSSSSSRATSSKHFVPEGKEDFAIENEVVYMYMYILYIVHVLQCTCTVYNIIYIQVYDIHVQYMCMC